MKHTLIFLITLLALTLNAQAQSYEMLYAPDTTWYDPADGDVTISSYLKNISGTTDSIFAKRIANERAPGHRTAFAWNHLSFAYEINSSEDAGIYVVLQDQEVDSSFQLVLSPDQNGGTTKVTMRFYNLNDTSKCLDQTYVFVSSSATAISQTELEHGIMLGKPYPNPAHHLVNIDYQLPKHNQKAYVYVVTLEGKQVLQRPLSPTENKATLSIRQLPAGVYFMYVGLDGRRIGQTRCLIR